MIEPAKKHGGAWVHGVGRDQWTLIFDKLLKVIRETFKH